MSDIKHLTQKLQQQIKDFVPPAGGEAPERHHAESNDCQICGGLGWLRQDLPLGHPDFGKLFACDCSRYQMYSTVSGMTQAECLYFRWSNIEPGRPNQQAVKAIKAVIKRGYGWVYLYGAPGTGKTLALKTAVAEVIREGKMASYTNMSAIIDDMRKAYDQDNPNGESDRRLEKWSTIEILAIDEFDRLRATEYAEERQFRLMDARYQLALSKNTVTIMASNETPLKFEPYLRDRLIDGRFEVVHLGGESVRQQPPQAEDWQLDL